MAGASLLNCVTPVAIQKISSNRPALLANTYVIGHLSPDSDSIGAAIGAAEFFGATAARTGPITQEVRFLLDHFNVQEPILLTDLTGKNMIIVDCNQKSQVPPTIAKAKVIRIIDHHALLEDPIIALLPIPVEIQPWGSTNTIIAKNYFFRNNREMSPSVAGMMLGAIFSDTLNLTTNTTTENGREMVAVIPVLTDIDGPTSSAYYVYLEFMRHSSTIKAFGGFLVEMLTKKP